MQDKQQKQEKGEDRKTQLKTVFVSFKQQAWDMNKAGEEDLARLCAHQCMSEDSTCMCVHAIKLHGKQTDKTNKQTNKQTNNRTIDQANKAPFMCVQNAKKQTNTQINCDLM